jgi:NADH-quinone oxidoreductase subunit H
MEFLNNPWVFATLTTLIKFVVLVMLFVMPLASVLTWMERRQSAYTQDRLGPWRAHFLKVGGKPLALGGLLHIAADGLKMFFKEPFIPRSADKWVFKIAPAIGFVTCLLIMSLIPFGPDVVTGAAGLWGFIPMQIARVDTGILLVFALGSLGIYSASLAGWASNNRFALMGSLRAAAQGISYEIALGLTVVGVLLAYGSTELSALVLAQEGTTFFGLLPRWGFVMQPLGAVLFLTAAIAETKRTPFDLPEGESEIIGYFVEYSSMGFGLFMLAEFVEIVVLASLFTTLFLGGWELPWVLGEDSLFLGFTAVPIGPWVHALLGMLVFGIKVFLVCAFQLQLRWTLPRFRYDQLMHLGWKVLLPLALLNIFVTAVLVYVDASLDVLASVGVLTMALFALVVLAGPSRGKNASSHAPVASH